MDTNVLIQSPYSIFAFEDNDIILADVTLEELDNLKIHPGEVGANSRESTRILEDLRHMGSLADGVHLPSGGLLKVETNHLACVLPKHWDDNKPDNRIIKVAKGLMEDQQNSKNPKKVILISQDINVRLKADLMGVCAQEYRADAVVTEYTGRMEGYISSIAMTELQKRYAIPVEEVLDVQGEVLQKSALIPNEFFILHDASNPSSNILAMYDGKIFKKINAWDKRGVYGVKPRNVGQSFALEALMAPVDKIPLVVLQGSAGTAKTFLSLAAALEQVINGGEHRAYNKILIARPNVKFDDTVGFLKGGEEEKIGPLMRPVVDNLEQLTESKCSESAQMEENSWKTKAQRKKAKGVYNTTDDADEDKFKALSSSSYVQELFETGLITAQAMEYMRGRSIPNTYILIDEAQNMSPTQAFGIVSRAGANTKVVLVGDPNQIDNPRLDKRTNGLSYTAAQMKGSNMCAQLTFIDKEVERSPLAKEAVEKMSPKGYRQ